MSYLNTYLSVYYNPKTNEMLIGPIYSYCDINWFYLETNKGMVPMNANWWRDGLEYIGEL